MAEEFVKEAFTFWDKDGDNFITPADLTALFESFNRTELNANADFAKVDADGDGKVTFEEFSALVQAEQTSFKKLFEFYDKNNTGSLSVSELKILIAKVGGDANRFDELMKLADKDIDGTVNYEEFVEIWKIAPRNAMFYKVAFLNRLLQ
jgi:Ca2+-binding EF-hand superfamily protein